MSDFNSSIIDHNKIQIIKLKGYLDAHTAPVLEENFTELISKNKFNIVVNFKDLNYISSAGLGVFMAYIEKIRENNGDIKLTEMNEKVYNIFDLLGFPLLYEIFDNDEQAINKFLGNKSE
jgi:anti-sigma B factor antagonist